VSNEPAPDRHPARGVTAQPGLVRASGCHHSSRRPASRAGAGRFGGRLLATGTRLAIGGALAAQLTAAPAQRQAFGVLSQFTWPDYYPPPHETQLRFLLKGGEAVPQAGGLLLVRQVTLEKFQETGARELLVSTPACLFNAATREAGSAETLRVQFGEDRLTLEGRGFLWQQTNALLIVSNGVRTTLRGGWLTGQPDAAPTLGDAQIVADSFRYDGKASEAEYRGQVRVSATNLSLSGGRLLFVLPAAGPGRVQRLTMQQDVTAAFGPLRASGDEAVYWPDQDRMRLEGHATWHTGDRQGSGQQLLLDRATRTLHVEGEAALKLRLGRHSLLGQRAAPAPGSITTNQELVITAARYEVLTNAARFNGQVRAEDRAGETTVARLDCATLTVALDPDNQPHSLLAEGGVVIEAGPRQLAADRAEYAAATGLLQLTGDPAWRDGPRSGQGQTVLLDWQANRLTVRGNASLNLPQTEAARFFGPLGRPHSSPAASHSRQVSPESDAAQVRCEEYTLEETGAAFRGGVQVRATQMQLTAATLDLTLATNGASVARLVANRDVVMSLVETNGQHTRITCARAQYTGADDLLELTGRPTVQQYSSSMTNRFEAERVTLHRATGQIRAQGRWSGSVLLPGKPGQPAAPGPKDRDRTKRRGGSSR